MCQVHEGCGSRGEHLYFLISKASPFPFPLKLSFAIVLLKPHNYPLIISLSFFFFFFFTLLSTPARPGFYVFCSCITFIQTVLYSHLLCCCCCGCFRFSQPTYEVVAHSQVIVPHRDLQGFLRQLVQGYIIWKLLCRWCTQEHIYINDS